MIYEQAYNMSNGNLQERIIATGTSQETSFDINIWHALSKCLVLTQQVAPLTTAVLQTMNKPTYQHNLLSLNKLRLDYPAVIRSVRYLLISVSSVLGICVGGNLADRN